MHFYAYFDLNFKLVCLKKVLKYWKLVRIYHKAP